MYKRVYTASDRSLKVVSRIFLKTWEYNSLKLWRFFGNTHGQQQALGSLIAK